MFVGEYGAIPFMAPFSIEGGSNFKETIHSNIDNCDLFVPLISSRTAMSAFVHQEIGHALSLKKDNILPVIIGRVNQKDLGFLYDKQYEKYGDKKLKKVLKNRIFKKYLKMILIWALVLIFFLFNRQIKDFIVNISASR